ncbi:MAG: glycosyl hydrolase family 8 [Paludibacteraceae bacterium]|nr:glycosyl hydrolase family 8 [Paludibacteraceae bacterium]
MFRRKKHLMGLFAGLCFAVSVLAKVPVNINSGMPAYPFPQFKSYKMGVNLGMKQYEGISHAEMEKDIRGAYQLFANEWEYSGEECDGVKYIRGNIGCPYDCSEGDGYSLLAAAYMGDKISFDGLWMRIHDIRRANQVRYLDGEPVGESEYGYNNLGDQLINSSAADGDWDIALALYIAWKQWGDDSGHTAFNGDAISYKKELIDVVSGLAEIYNERFKNETPTRVTSGNIGLDGYPKNGNTWVEVTDWATENKTEYDGVTLIPEYAGTPSYSHADYLAPAYYYEFYKLLDEINTESDKEWLKRQFLRATASSDWIMGNWLEQDDKYLPYAEEYTINDDNTVTLKSGNQGGRFRSVWRTSLNYIWHGNPNFTWNPETHQVEDKPNTYEQTVCKRAAAYCAAPQKWTGEDCVDFLHIPFDGPSVLSWDMKSDGSSNGNIYFTFNWIPGVSAASAVGAEDLDLTAKLYRQCQIEWDLREDSVPTYFDGWFRLLGMLTATGNLPAPSDMKSDVNLRLYKSVEGGKNTCHPGDIVTNILSYRNYGSEYSKEFEIIEKIPDGFEFVSADNGGVYDPTENTITFSIDIVGGRIYDHLDKTQGSVSYKIKAKEDAAGVYNTISTLSYDGKEITADIYPNNVTATYEVNSITVVPEPNQLKITTETDKSNVNIDDEVEYTITFSNVDDRKSYLVGGRKDVNISASMNEETALNIGLFHDAAEPLINYGNYRVSYFSSDIKRVSVGIYEPLGSQEKIKTSIDTISYGDGETGALYKINLQFCDALAAPTAHLDNYFGSNTRIHEGETMPLRAYVYLWNLDYSINTDDYSYSDKCVDQQDDLHFPVSPRYSTYGDAENTEEILQYIPSLCQEAEFGYTNLAVEEWDGNTWRLIQGNLPIVGYDVTDVIVYDTIPFGLEFVEFTSDCPLKKLAKLEVEKLSDGRDLITWRSPSMPANKEYKISFKTKVSEEASLGDIENVSVISDDRNYTEASHSTIKVDELQGVSNLASNKNLDIVAPNPTKTHGQSLEIANTRFIAS